MTDNHINNTVATDYGWYTSSRTSNLRFVEREGKRILQQQRKIEHSKEGVSYQWKDIPVEDE